MRLSGALCGKAVWRSPGESIQEDVTTRTKAFEGPMKYCEETNISDDLQDHFWLKFAGLESTGDGRFGNAVAALRPDLLEASHAGSAAGFAT